MRITRLKKGFRIVCSDSEFSALDALIGFGMSDMENEASVAGLPPAVKRVIRSDRFQKMHGPMTVDQDNR